MAKSKKKRKKAATAPTLLRRLRKLHQNFGGGAAQKKLEALRLLERRTLSRPGEVFALHEVLCFLRAYPDSPQILKQVEKMLARFDKRADLRRFRRRFRDDLADTGIAGTPLHYAFFWFTACWLARRWPGRLSVDWDEFEAQEKLEGMLSLLLPYSETPAVDGLDLPLREWVEHLKGPGETGAAFLIRRFQELAADPFMQEKLFDDLEIPLRIDPGPDTPSRTRARYPRSPVVFQTGPLDQSRPSLQGALRQPPPSVRAVPPREGQKLIDLAREAMATRQRDLDVFEHPDKNDVRLVDCGGGLQFACIGSVPERRLMLESVYGFLTLRNGVPVGYVLASALFGSSEVAFNVFETFRGAESSRTFARVLAMVRFLFGSDAFTIDPYQLGYDNEEGLASGAWWFYYKLGFRPHDPEVRRILRSELACMKKNPWHRSSVSTLQKLSAESVFFYLGRERKDVLGQVSLGNVGFSISRYLARRFGSERAQGIRTCAKEAAALLGVGSFRGFTPAERLWWDRWSPLVLALPGVERWSRVDKRALAGVIRAKGGRRESGFVRLFDRHRRLRRAVLKLAARG